MNRPEIEAVLEFFRRTMTPRLAAKAQVKHLLWRAVNDAGVEVVARRLRLSPQTVWHYMTDDYWRRTTGNLNVISDLFFAASAGEFRFTLAAAPSSAAAPPADKAGE